MQHNLALLAALALSTAVPAAALAQPQPTPPDYYVGVGIRAGLNDPTAFVIDSKAKLLELGSSRTTLSARPSVLFEDNTELRLPLTVDFAVNPSIYPYAGAGVAYNADGGSRVDPMITAGLDFGVARNLVLDINLSTLFKPGNADTEFTATINYEF
ncbi:MAG: hypothetical protein EA368_14380 [Leptolyngbya sp. DLM2.Bin27]|nr:MAG: hypothetical protein EA368_14380 [Leptolyngbya sp. DLM2.Bin27]